ncbi:hypothetical protein J437_LFUL012913 [Ladona fulva]|uniref:Caspase family p20 domain-containing protein n=1 Tax=Ladona fulva TaxID=123851 RepID=A0A8K0P590_LADFU|nr:hypothetical protein J437_LFUL012913 [Ladona fulva]
MKTPTSDVETLAKILEKLKFKVVALRNLTALEMRNALHKFCKMLLEGTYVVFYYVGHGFEIGGKCMLPVDAPTTYLRSDCLIETESWYSSDPKNYGMVFNILNGLSLFEQIFLFIDWVIDKTMFPHLRESNPAIHQESHPVHKFEPSRNLITGYATTSNLGAYERSSETNGIYAKHLAKALLDHHDLPIIKVLEKVNKGVSAEGGEASAKQMPFVGHNTHKDYYFSVEVEGNEEARQKYEDLVQHPTVMDLNFSRRNLTAKAFVTPHRGTFLNSLDIRIVGLDSWKVILLLGNSELQLQKQWTDNGLMVTLHNLQKMKSTLMITVELKDPHTGHTVDDDMLVLNKPLVCKWELWFRSPVNEVLDLS